MTSNESGPPSENEPAPARLLQHEIRGSLTSLLMAAELLRRENRSDELAAIVGRQAAHIQALIEDFVDSQEPLRRQCLDLRSVVPLIEDIAWPLAKRCRVGLTVVLPRRPVLVDADETKIAQAVSNLVTNAIQHTPSGGAVTVTVGDDRQRGVAVTAVEDTGVGLEPHHPRAAFAPSRRGASRVHTFGNNSGLGLPLVRSIVNAHGGALAVESHGQNKGSRFTIELPLAKPCLAVSPSSANAPLARARFRNTDDQSKAIA